MGTENSRKYKIEWIRNEINSFFKEKPNGQISKSKLSAVFAIELGSTERTARDIINSLSKIGVIELEGDIIKNAKSS